MWQRNKTADWVQNLSEEQKQLVFKQARLSVNKQKEKVKYFGDNYLMLNGNNG